MKHFRRFLLIAAVLGASAFGGYLANVFAPRPAQAAPPALLAPTTRLTLLDVPNKSTEPDTFGVEPVKIADIGTFEVANPESLVEVTHQGRLLVESITNANGVFFELRVDDETGIALSPAQPSGIALVRSDETNQYVVSNFSGYWENLSAGSHTVSIWVRTSTGAMAQGNNALLDPGGWPTNLVIVKEYLPFGTTFLPSIQK